MLSAVEPFNVAGRYGPLLAALYPAYARSFGADHFGWGVDHVRILVLFDDRPVADVWAESEVNGFRVRGESIGADLDRRRITARLESVRVAGVGTRHRQAARHVH